ncbi:TPA: acyl-CoA dehydrogenase, partial [Providencia stuartii]
MTLLSIILFLALIGILCYHKTSLTLSTVLLLAYTAVMGVLDVWSYWMLLPVALVLFPFVFTPVRQSLVSVRALKMFQKVMPPMSRTEKEAIDAGTTWWEGDLFRGAPDWNKLHNYPKPQ